MVSEIMIEFAKKTGLSPECSIPARYLWTDAYAVCNFLGLYRQTNNELYKHFALLLIDQVHATLGRHRRDGPRTGWISGLAEEEGRRHPTKGGLRIGGKRLKNGDLWSPLMGAWNGTGMGSIIIT